MKNRQGGSKRCRLARLGTIARRMEPTLEDPIGEVVGIAALAMVGLPELETAVGSSKEEAVVMEASKERSMPA